jgi:drug/metabolite transporter (DMT)-like permease
MPDRLLLPLFVALWSSGYVVGALAIQVADPLPLLAVRFVLASLVLVPLALRSGRWRGAPLGRLAVLGLLLHVAQFGGIYGGFALGVPAALSALVMLGLSPLVTSALAVGSGQERGDPWLWAGLGVGVVGVAISLAPELGDARIGAGVALTLAGMVGLAAGTVLQRRWAGAADPRVSAAAQNATAGLVVVPLAAVTGGRLHVDAQLVLSLAWIGWGLGVGTLLVFVTLLRRHAASTVGSLLLLVPAVTAVGSAVALGERLHPASVLGMAVATVGVGTVLRRRSDVSRTELRDALAQRTASRTRTPRAGRVLGVAAGDCVFEPIRSRSTGQGPRSGAAATMSRKPES